MGGRHWIARHGLIIISFTQIILGVFFLVVLNVGWFNCHTTAKSNVDNLFRSSIEILDNLTNVLTGIEQGMDAGRPLFTHVDACASNYTAVLAGQLNEIPTFVVALEKWEKSLSDSGAKLNNIGEQFQRVPALFKGVKDFGVSLELYGDTLLDTSKAIATYREELQTKGRPALEQTLKALQDIRLIRSQWEVQYERMLASLKEIERSIQAIKASVIILPSIFRLLILCCNILSAFTVLNGIWMLIVVKQQLAVLRTISS